VLIAPRIPSRFDDLATALCDVTFVALDLETTGMSPGRDAITEIGAVKYRAGECLGRFDTLVNPDGPSGPSVTNSLPHIDAVLPALLEFIGNAVLVGHNFRFDTSFLDAALVRWGGPPLDNPRVDTLGIARRILYEDVLDHRLATIAHHLGSSVEPCHRALADAEATAEVFHALLERAGTFGVVALDDLLALTRLRRHPSMSKLRLLARAPRGPGVYQFQDREGRVIFVSRATNLRTRMRSHFYGGPGRRVPQVVLDTESIDWLECANELEASVREARLIARIDPRFNRKSKNAGGHAYLKLSLRERFPRLSVVRTARNDGALYFGPLRSKVAAHDLRAAIERAVPVRRCAKRIDRTPHGAETCPSPTGPMPCPCLGELTEAEYQPVVDTITRGLRNNPEALTEPLARQIEICVAAEDYEAAATARDHLGILVESLRQQSVLESLRASPSTRFVSPTGVIEFEHGCLRLGDDDELERPNTPLERQLDELLVVARWIEHETGAGRIRPL
jgi:DNA polymerase III subunit epsilon